MLDQAAPDFALPATGGQTLSLSALHGRKVVLYFYPKADTPGCTKEAIAFNGLKAAFARTVAPPPLLDVTSPSAAAGGTGCGHPVPPAASGWPLCQHCPPARALPPPG